MVIYSCKAQNLVNFSHLKLINGGLELLIILMTFGYDFLVKTATENVLIKCILTVLVVRIASTIHVSSRVSSIAGQHVLRAYLLLIVL